MHIAFYEFADVARARAVVGSAEMAAMRAEFDGAWQDRVKRPRELVGITQEI